MSVGSSYVITGSTTEALDSTNGEYEWCTYGARTVLEPRPTYRPKWGATVKIPRAAPSDIGLVFVGSPVVSGAE